MLLHGATWYPSNHDMEAVRSNGELFEHFHLASTCEILHHSCNNSRCCLHNKVYLLTILLALHPGHAGGLSIHHSHMYEVPLTTCTLYSPYSQFRLLAGKLHCRVILPTTHDRVELNAFLSTFPQSGVGSRNFSDRGILWLV